MCNVAVRSVKTCALVARLGIHQVCYTLVSFTYNSSTCLTSMQVRSIVTVHACSIKSQTVPSQPPLKCVCLLAAAAPRLPACMRNLARLRASSCYVSIKKLNSCSSRVSSSHCQSGAYSSAAAGSATAAAAAAALLLLLLLLPPGTAPAADDDCAGGGGSSSSC
jgi:hypothetical protein